MRRPPHIITPAEVDDWLADSANTRATYHRTTRDAAEDVVEHGVDIAKSRIAAYDQGFYTATEADAFDGEAELLVAIRTRNPLLGGIDEIEQLVDGMARRLYPSARGRLSLGVAVAIRRELLRLGYDGMVIKDAGGDGVDFVVAIAPETVKVVVA